MGKRREKTSMHDIAEVLNISKNAVSLALNNKPGVSEVLRKQIIQTAKDMNYSGVRKNDNNKSGNILIIVPEYITNDEIFYSEVYWSIEKEAQSRGYVPIMTSLSSSTEAKIEKPDILDEVEFVGILLIGVVTKDYLKMLLNFDIPIVTVDNYYEALPICSVVTANIEGAYSIVKHLIENGHKDIGYIGSIHMTTSLFERWCGYYKAMNEHQLRINNEYCILSSSPLGELLHNADDLNILLSNKKNLPTAWFCGGDRIAIGLINALNKRNLRVPEDISVVGFDDIELSSLINPPLTTIRVDREAMGRSAIEYLLKKVDKQVYDYKLSIYGKLIVRSSVKNLNANK